MSEHTPWIYAHTWWFVDVSCFIVWRPTGRGRRLRLHRRRSNLSRKNLQPSRLWRQLLSRWRVLYSWNLWWLYSFNLNSSCVQLSISIFIVAFCSPKWRNQWRTTYPRSPLSHKCHRSQLKLNPLPSRTASLLQHNKVSTILWYSPILKVTYFETNLLYFCFSAEKPEDNQAPKPAKKKKARRETWDRSVCKRLPLRFMQHPFFFSLFARRLLTKTFFCDWSRTFNSSLEAKTAFINTKHPLTDHWKLIMDTVQSFVKWRRWFSPMDLILFILSLTPLNLVTNGKSCIVEFRCRKYWSC